MSYEEKYLKYKNKYLALKKQILSLGNGQDQPVEEPAPSAPSTLSGLFNNFSLNNIFGGGEEKIDTETTLPGMNSDVPEEKNGGARGRARASRKGRKTSSRKHSRNFLTSSSSDSSSSKSDSDSYFDSSELEWH